MSVLSTKDTAELQLFETGGIPDRSYVEGIANAKYPVGSSDFHFYMHDVASEHFASIMVFGELTDDLMAQTASGILESNSVQFFDNQAGETRTFEGEERIAQAAGYFDSFTNQLGYVSLQAEPLAGETRGAVMEAKLEDSLRVLRQTGRLESTKIVQAMIHRGIIIHASEVTARTLLDELVVNARERLGVVPNEAANPFADLSSDFGDDDLG